MDSSFSNPNLNHSKKLTMMQVASLLILWSCLIWTGVQAITSDDSSTSPLKQWNSAFAASSAQSSCLAMKYNKECVILLYRSPLSNRWKPYLSSPSAPSQSTELLGLPVTPVESSVVQHAPSWMSFPNGQVLAMTGFAADVDHLARTIQKHADNHQTIYEESMTTHSMTTKLAAVVQKVAQSGGRRPFGVQALLIGGDDIDPSRGLCIYSIDPSGSWQSWGQGASIGRYSNKLRKELAKSLSSSSSSSLEEALSQLIGCWVDTCRAENLSLSEEEDLEVLVLHRNPTNGHCGLFIVDNDHVKSTFTHLSKAASSS
mmetsp:Transcript_9236/g.22029  ORF Transcript_9236/g.22029 Transcript_9236/m.22029 type:complete len:315 (+) Transcript_9236:317-1261(+)